MLFDIAITVTVGADSTALERVIGALERSRYQNFVVSLWFDPDREDDIRRRFEDDWRVRHLCVAPGDDPGVFSCWNIAMSRCRADAFVYLTDDLELCPECLGALRQGFEKWGLDAMAPLRIAQGGVSGCGPCPGAAALGADFMDRFVRRRCFCPEYRWFHGDTELTDFARQVGCLRQADGARALRFTTPWMAMEPACLQERRRRQRRDRRVLRAHRQEGRIWGLGADDQGAA